jgi:drug/metabolite transporter (DMT)-like permease
MNTSRSSTWIGLLALFVVYIVWGSTYLAIRYAVREGSGFPPFTMAGSRALLGGVILLLVAGSLRQRLRPTRTELGRLALSALLLWIGGNGLVTWAEQSVHSGFAALVVGTTPIFSAIIESFFNRRRPSGGLLLALAVGFAGLFLLTWPVISVGGRGNLLATLAAGDDLCLCEPGHRGAVGLVFSA